MTATKLIEEAGRRSVRQAVRGTRGIRRVASRHHLASIAPGSRLHLGCGSNRFDGWVNLDLKRYNGPDIRHDLRLGLLVRTGTLSRIYSEHVFEHLDLADAERLMRDCRAALAADGVMRVAMPDLSTLVDRYRGEWENQEWLRNGEYPHITSAAQMLNTALREWGHRYVYDVEDLRARLGDAGFGRVDQVAWGESEYRDLRGLETRPDSLLVVEAHV